MKKNEFKKMMKKENKAFKNYYVYEMILILLLAIIVIPNIILTINNMIPFNITFINTILIIIVALPIIVLDIKNDLDIKNIHQYYLKEKKIPEYKDKTTINVALVMNDVAMKNSQIEEYVKTMESTYKNYSKDVKLNFWERNNHKIGEMEFTTEGSDTEIYNHIIVFSVNDKLRLVNFNCTKEQMSEWKEVSKFIVDSIMFE